MAYVHGRQRTQIYSNPYSMKIRLLLGFTLALLLSAASSVQAQFGPPPGRGGGGAGGGMGGKPPGVSAALNKIFGKTKAFSAKAQMTAVDASGKELMSGPAEFAFSEGNAYFSMDLSEMKSDRMPPQAAAQMKAFGLSQITSVTKADAKVVYLIYPGLQSYVEMPVSAEDQSISKAETKTEKLGEETINGFECVKNKTTISYDGKSEEILAWNAKKLNDFPVRVVYSDGGQKVTMDYKDIKQEKPDAKLFTTPAGFTKYDNVQQMLQAGMMKKFGAPPAP